MKEEEALESWTIESAANRRGFQPAAAIFYYK